MESGWNLWHAWTFPRSTERLRPGRAEARRDDAASGAGAGGGTAAVAKPLNTTSTDGFGSTVQYVVV